jgi:hypothetical protein
MSAPSPAWPAPGDWVWVSKYAATTGLLRVRVARVMATGGVEVEAGYQENHFRPGEFHRTEAEACGAAFHVVILEIADCQRRIDHMQGLATEYARLAEETEAVP